MSPKGYRERESVGNCVHALFTPNSRACLIPAVRNNPFLVTSSPDSFSYPLLLIFFRILPPRWRAVLLLVDQSTVYRMKMHANTKGFPGGYLKGKWRTNWKWPGFLVLDATSRHQTVSTLIPVFTFKIFLSQFEIIATRINLCL